VPGLLREFLSDIFAVRALVPVVTHDARWSKVVLGVLADVHELMISSTWTRAFFRWIGGITYEEFNSRLSMPRGWKTKGDNVQPWCFVFLDHDNYFCRTTRCDSLFGIDERQSRVLRIKTTPLYSIIIGDPMLTVFRDIAEVFVICEPQRNAKVEPLQHSHWKQWAYWRAHTQ
jgi:hypothetical protein